MLTSSSVTDSHLTTSQGDTPPATDDQQTKKEEKPAAAMTEDESYIPDGGVTAWLTALGAFLIQFCGFGFTNSYGVFQAYYSQHYLTNVSSSAIAWIGSVNTFLVLSGGLFFGRLYDRGYFYWLAIGGCVLQSFSLFMLSLVQPGQYYQLFICHGLGIGLGASLTYVPSIAVLSQHFRHKRAIMMAVVAGGAPLGGTVLPILLNNLLNGSLGFANGVRASSAFISSLLLAACLLMRTRLPPQKTTDHYLEVLNKSCRDSAYVCASLGMFFFAGGSFFPLFYIQLDSTTHGLGKTFSFYTLAILNMSNFVGRSSIGFIAKYLGIPNSVIGTTLCSTFTIFAITGLATRASAVTIGILFGFFSGSYVALSVPLIALLTPDLSVLGARIGIALALAGVGGLIGTPISGALLTTNYIWWRPAVFCGCFAGASSILFTIAELARKRRLYPNSEADTV